MSTNVTVYSTRFCYLFILFCTAAVSFGSCEKENFGPGGSHSIHSTETPADTTITAEGIVTEEPINNEP
jgi:hypothetical protein